MSNPGFWSRQTLAQEISWTFPGGCPNKPLPCKPLILVSPWDQSCSPVAPLNPAWFVGWGIVPAGRGILPAGDSSLHVNYSINLFSSVAWLCASGGGRAHGGQCREVSLWLDMRMACILMQVVVLVGGSGQAVWQCQRGMCFRAVYLRTWTP